MNIVIRQSKPTTAPLRQYDTQLVYIGFRFRYDTHRKTLSSIEKCPDGTISYTEVPSETTVFSKGYHTENVRVTVYTDSPKVWCEEISATDYFVFAQQPTQAA
jgi:hypothetical protein